MASTIYKVTSLVFIFIIVLTGFGSALRVITEPEDYNEMTSDQLNVTCITDGPTYWAQTIVAIQIMKEDQVNPIVTVSVRQELTMGPNSRDNMKGEGHVDKDASLSYLTLIINKADEEDAGSYKCQVMYFDESFNVMKESVTANVTFRDPDMTDIVTDLMGKVSALVTTVKEQGIFDSKHNDTILRLEKLIKDSNAQLNKTIKTQGKQHLNFMDVHFVQKEDIDILTVELSQQNDTIMKQNKEIEELQTYHRVHTQQFNELKKDIAKHQQQHTAMMDLITQQNKSIHTLEMELQVQELNKQGCPDKGWKHYTQDHTCLKIFGTKDRKKRLSWSEAREACQVLGGDLAIITDKDKSKFVASMYNASSHERIWIGIKNSVSRGDNFKYVDGSDLGSYQPWFPVPTIGRGVKDCVAMSYSRLWQKWSCLSQFSYMCSKTFYDVI